MLESISGVIALLALIGTVGYLIAAFSGRKARRSAELIGAGVSGALFVTALVVSSLAAKPASPPESAQPSEAAKRPQIKDPAIKAAVGTPAPGFKLETLDGSDFDLKKQRGKVVLLNFFATWCGPCMEELPHIEELWKHYGGSGLSMLVIDREEPEKTARDFVTKQGFTFPVAADPKTRVYSLYAKESIPRTFLISRQGAVVYATSGFFEEDTAALRQAIERELAQP
jgi:peroxiredoxin